MNNSEIKLDRHLTFEKDSNTTHNNEPQSETNSDLFENGNLLSKFSDELKLSLRKNNQPLMLFTDLLRQVKAQTGKELDTILYSKNTKEISRANKIVFEGIENINNQQCKETMHRMHYQLNVVFGHDSFSKDKTQAIPQAEAKMPWSEKSFYHSNSPKFYDRPLKNISIEKEVLDNQQIVVYQLLCDWLSKDLENAYLTFCREYSKCIASSGIRFKNLINALNLEQQIVFKSVEKNQEAVMRALQQVLDKLFPRKESSAAVEKLSALKYAENDKVQLSSFLTVPGDHESSAASAELAVIAFQWLQTTGIFDKIELVQGKITDYTVFPDGGSKQNSIDPCSYIKLYFDNRFFLYDPLRPIIGKNLAGKEISNPRMIESLSRKIIWYTPSKNNEQAYS